MSWGSTEQIKAADPNNLPINGASVAINNNGKAVAAWRQQSALPIGIGLFVAVNDGSGWTDGVFVASYSLSISDFTSIYVGIDDSDNIIVVWQNNLFQDTFQPNDVRAGWRGQILTARSTDFGKTWSSAELLATGCNNISTIGCNGRVSSSSCNFVSPKTLKSFDMNRKSGKAILIWEKLRSCDDNTSSIFSSFFNGTFWSLGGRVAASSGVFSFEQSVSMNDKDNAMAIWIEGSYGEPSTPYASFFLNESWGPKVCLAPNCAVEGDESFLQPSVSLNSDNNALAVWGSGDSTMISAAYFDGGRWSNSTVIGDSAIGSDSEVCLLDSGNGALAAVKSGQFPNISQFNGTTKQWSDFRLFSLSFPDPALRYQGCIPVLAGDCSGDSASGIIAISKDTQHSNNTELVAVVCCHLPTAGAPPAPALGATMPTNVMGVCLLNRFPMHGEFFKTISWTPSIDTDIVSQNIVRDDVVIANVAPTQSFYADHNRPPQNETYGIVAINQAGLSSSPAEATPE